MNERGPTNCSFFLYIPNCNPGAETPSRMTSPAQDRKTDELSLHFGYPYRTRCCKQKLYIRQPFGIRNSAGPKLDCSTGI